MKIETIEIAGLAGALTALRLPFGKEVRSGIVAKNKLLWFINTDDKSWAGNTYEIPGNHIAVDFKDLTLMQTLVKRGDEHAKVVRGIMVWARITAPVYWWCEEETYRA